MSADGPAWSAVIVDTAFSVDVLHVSILKATGMIAMRIYVQLDSQVVTQQVSAPLCTLISAELSCIQAHSLRAEGS